MSTSYADGRTLTLQTILPVFEGERYIEPSSRYVDMPRFKLHPDSTPCPSHLLPAGSNPEVSPDTVESTLVTVIPREDFINLAIVSLDDVPSLPIDTSDNSNDPSSSVALPDPSPYLTFVRNQAPVLPLPERPHISPRKKRNLTRNLLL